MNSKSLQNADDSQNDEKRGETKRNVWLEIIRRWFYLPMRQDA